MKNIKNIIISVLFFLVIFLSLRVYYLRLDYLETINNRIITQEMYGIKYKTIVSEKTSYKVIVGDILGIDKKSYNFVDNIELKENEPFLLIPGVNKKYDKITSDNFSYLIANKNNVFIPDNFCLKNWPSTIDSDLYNNSHLSRGSFCASENEVMLIDRLIKQYRPSVVEIYYSSETYKDLIKGFLLYLEDLEIQYKLIKI